MTVNGTGNHTNANADLWEANNVMENMTTYTMLQSYEGHGIGKTSVIPSMFAR